ncbi:hypothetical protein EV356DRAFT_504450 [Viridothelium virens]|uniref:Uncharacterized protein n=1 Tax=Viridothelium virens TaxID=1048519 RepID=A0A6A6H5I9_VIRVR|nr:hypothetical protein EV356DRAFT_504450 [Viridothelium virens]
MSHTGNIMKEEFRVERLEIRASEKDADVEQIEAEIKKHHRQAEIREHLVDRNIARNLARWNRIEDQQMKKLEELLEEYPTMDDKVRMKRYVKEFDAVERLADKIPSNYWDSYTYKIPESSSNNVRYILARYLREFDQIKAGIALSCCHTEGAADEYIQSSLKKWPIRWDNVRRLYYEGRGMNDDDKYPARKEPYHPAWKYIGARCPGYNELHWTEDMLNEERRPAETSSAAQAPPAGTLSPPGRRHLQSSDAQSQRPASQIGRKSGERRASPAASSSSQPSVAASSVTSQKVMAGRPKPSTAASGSAARLPQKDKPQSKKKEQEKAQGPWRS